MNKITSLTKEDIENLFSRHNSIRSILLELGVNSNGSGAYNVFKFHCLDQNCIIPDFKYAKRKQSGKRELKEILTKNSVHQNRSQLKQRLIRGNLLINECFICKVSEWNGKKLSLHLDHINGVNDDNRLENLRLLCPNCHSQTDTYGGKKRKKERVKVQTEETKIKVAHIKQRKVDRPSYEVLISELAESNYSALGRKYGVSDNAIRKWIKFYKIYGELAER